MIRVRLGISALCALDHFHLYNRPDAVLGHAGFLSAPLTHLLSSAINFDLRKRLLLLLMWVSPSSCRCMLGLFLCRLVMMESFIQSFWCFLGTLIIYHLYCSLVKEEVPALIWAVQHFEVYSHQRLECDKHTQSDPWPGDQWQSVFFSIWSRVTFSVRELTRSLGEVFSSGLLHSLTLKLDSRL